MVKAKAAAAKKERLNNFSMFSDENHENHDNQI